MAPSWFGNQEGKPAASSRRPSGAGASGAMMKLLPLSLLLSDDLILIAPEGLGKEGLVDFLVRKLCDKYALGDSAPFLAKVLEREQGISTTLDTGLAVPHARIDRLESIAAVLALVPKGLSDPKQPDLTIRAMFLFFSPNRQDVFTQHLHLLRGVASLFQAHFIDEIIKAADGAAALKLIAAKENAV